MSWDSFVKKMVVGDYSRVTASLVKLVLGR